MPAERKTLVDYAANIHEVSINRACKLLKVSRSVYSYVPNLALSDREIKRVLTALAEKHCRYGFKKMFQKTRQLGFQWNHKRVYRVYCELKLNLRKKPKKRLPSRIKVKLVQPDKPNTSWSLDFMSDALINGRKFRTVNILDDWNREAMGIKASHTLPAERVTDYLDWLAMQRGYPKQLRVDNGPENISERMRVWAHGHGVRIQYIQPGKPAQNGYIERFNRTYRDEILDMYVFKNIAEVQSYTDKWLLEYNGERPHESLGNLTPWAFAKRLVSTDALY